MNPLVQIFKALSDPNRIRIIKMLEIKPLCVCEITAILNLATSTVSKHLSILKEAGFIFEQKEGKWVNYHLNRATQQQEVRELLLLTLKNGINDPMIQADREKIKSVDRATICSG
ncbi:winged helix-turn-helix transcriptional regulator [candidate division KSB1 bacterium]|nr:winged helix-turn-helix transcriptional regulator [candidate division KSB1 bacterium]